MNLADQVIAQIDFAQRVAHHAHVAQITRLELKSLRDAPFELRQCSNRARKLTHSDHDQRRLRRVMQRAKTLDLLQIRRALEEPIRLIDKDRAPPLSQCSYRVGKIFAGRSDAARRPGPSRCRRASNLPTIRDAPLPRPHPPVGKHAAWQSFYRVRSVPR
jgi:hypothetical protein